MDLKTITIADAKNRVRFVTVFIEKTTSKEKIKFTEVGDLTKTKVGTYSLAKIN